jgi:hypothetical protein
MACAGMIGGRDLMMLVETIGECARMTFGEMIGAHDLMAVVEMRGECGRMTCNETIGPCGRMTFAATGRCA